MLYQIISMVIRKFKKIYQFILLIDQVQIFPCNFIISKYMQIISLHLKQNYSFIRFLLKIHLPILIIQVIVFLKYEFPNLVQ